MKKNHFTILAVICSVSIIGLSACGHKDTSVVMPAQEVVKDSAKATTISNLNNLMSNIPDPATISKEITTAGLQMNKGVLNSPDKASNYTSTFQQAVNMGVYGADLGYLSSYGQMQDVINYFAQVAKLGSGLGITSTYDQKLIDIIKADANKKDTLNALIQTSFDQAQKELYANKRASVATLIFAGGWIEGLYIATNVITDEKNAKNQALYQRIWNHVFAITYLQQALGDYAKTNTDCANMQNLIKPIGDLAGNLPNDGFTLKDIQNIKAMVTDIRNKLI